MSLGLVIWLFPLAYLIHDLEEIFTIEKWMQVNKPLLLERANRNRVLRRFANSVDLSSGQFAAAFGFLFLIVIIGSYTATRSLPYSFGIGFFISLVGIMFLHCFSHLGQTLMLRKYTPGVVTAILVIIPDSLYTFQRIFAAGLVDWHFVILSVVIGAIFVVPLLLFSHYLGRRLVPHSQKIPK